MYEAAQNFELISNIQDQNLKNQKHIAVNVLFKAYPMIRYHFQADPIWPDGTFNARKRTDVDRCVPDREESNKMHCKNITCVDCSVADP